MNKLSIHIQERVLHFLQPAGTSRGVYTERRIWLVTVSDGQRQGVGECAPLPDLSCDALPPIIYNNVLRRVSFKQSQTTQHARERMLNVEDAFCLKDGSGLDGKHVLLIDDIVTTGATVIACGRTLAAIPGIRVSVMSLGLTKG